MCKERVVASVSGENVIFQPPLRNFRGTPTQVRMLVNWNSSGDSMPFRNSVDIAWEVGVVSAELCSFEQRTSWFCLVGATAVDVGTGLISAKFPSVIMCAVRVTRRFAELEPEYATGDSFRASDAVSSTLSLRPTNE